MVKLLDRLGFPHEYAAGQARLGVAPTRGLLHDLWHPAMRPVRCRDGAYLRLGEARSSPSKLADSDF